MQVVILAALLPEARAIARAFRLSGDGAGWFACNAVVNKDVRVQLVGPGARRLPTITRDQVRGVIMAGLGGALAPELKVGDVVIQGLPERVPVFSDGVRAGRLTTATGIVAGPAEKAALFRETGALAVDMETCRTEAWARETGVPFLAVRAISDTAHERLDPAVLGFVDSDGRPRIGRVLRHLAGHPTKLPAILRLGRASQFALSRLTATLEAILKTGWPENI